jgi:hypothetical protein
MKNEDEPEESNGTPGSDASVGDQEYAFDEDWKEIPDEEASRILRGLESLVPGIVKRVITSGIGTLTSDDGIRSAITDKSLPKEVVGFILGQADSTRKEILRIVSREVQVFLENMDFGGELSKILTTLSFEIRTEVRFVPNDEAVLPRIRHQVKVRKSGADEDQEFDDESHVESVGTEDESTEDAPEEAEGPDRNSRGRWRRRSSKGSAVAESSRGEGKGGKG